MSTPWACTEVVPLPAVLESRVAEGLRDSSAVWELPRHLEYRIVTDLRTWLHDQPERSEAISVADARVRPFVWRLASHRADRGRHSRAGGEGPDDHRNGVLTRADWDTGTSKAYASQTVTLQWIKKSTSTWIAVKTPKTDAGRKLTATTPATADGSYRLTFAGDATSNVVTSAADYVDVQ
jgi:hypothetical protein